MKYGVLRNQKETVRINVCFRVKSIFYVTLLQLNESVRLTALISFSGSISSPASQEIK